MSQGAPDHVYRSVVALGSIVPRYIVLSLAVSYTQDQIY
jgi:hypothetical protein